MPDSDALFRRFPQLADLESMDDAERLEAFQHVLDQLQHDLDESR